MLLLSGGNVQGVHTQNLSKGVGFQNMAECWNLVTKLLRIHSTLPADFVGSSSAKFFCLR